MSGPEAIKHSMLLLLLFTAAGTDIRERRIPNWLTVTAWILRIPVFTAEWFITGREAFVWGAADAAESILLLLGLAIFSTFTRYNLGFGDIKLLGTMALYQGAEKTLACLLYGLFLAACISLLLLAVRRINHKDKLPLAPFFLAGYLLLLWKSC